MQHGNRRIYDCITALFSLSRYEIEDVSVLNETVLLAHPS